MEGTFQRNEFEIINANNDNNNKCVKNVHIQESNLHNDLNLL